MAVAPMLIRSEPRHAARLRGAMASASINGLQAVIMMSRWPGDIRSRGHVSGACGAQDRKRVLFSLVTGLRQRGAKSANRSNLFCYLRPQQDSNQRTRLRRPCAAAQPHEL